MAVDLFVMPLSRYWSGDYITVAMRAAWAAGYKYAIEGPNGERHSLPEGVPFGGPHAPFRRRELLPAVEAVVAALALPAASHWDEESDAEPISYRVPSASFAALIDSAEQTVSPRSSVFRRLLGRSTSGSHLLQATIFLPADIPVPRRATDVTFGSIPRLEAELSAMPASAASSAALSDFQSAIGDSRRLCLPLILDQ